MCLTKGIESKTEVPNARKQLATLASKRARQLPVVPVDSQSCCSLGNLAPACSRAGHHPHLVGILVYKQEEVAHENLCETEAGV